MTVYISRQPGETIEAFNARARSTARRPNPDQMARIVALLRSGRPLGIPAPALTVEGVDRDPDAA